MTFLKEVKEENEKKLKALEQQSLLREKSDYLQKAEYDLKEKERSMDQIMVEFRNLEVHPTKR